MSVMNRFMSFLGLQEEEEVVEREQIHEEDEYEPAPVETRKNQRGNVVSIHSQKMSRLYYMNHVHMMRHRRLLIISVRIGR